MDKASLVNRFASSPEQRVLFAHILDLALRSKSKNIVVSGNFISEADAYIASDMICAAGDYSFILFGGYPDAERKCPVFIPDYFNSDDILREPSLADISFAEISVSKFDSDKAEFSHRDCLGALMALGIEREMIGDILTSGNSAIIILKTQIADFVKENLDGIGRYKVSVILSDKAEITKKEDFEFFSNTVASMRLDGVIASVFKLSRGGAAEAIERGLVTVNGVTTMKTDSNVSEGSRISFRGKGRVIIEQVQGLSKKGRIRFIYKK